MNNYQHPSGILRNLPRHCLEISFFCMMNQTTEVCPTLCIEFTRGPTKLPNTACFGLSISTPLAAK